MKVEPAAAFCAVGPDGVIDIDLLRRSESAARWAAGAHHRTGWAALEADGWEVLPVWVAPPPSVMAPLAKRPAPPLVARADDRPLPSRGPAEDGRLRLLRCAMPTKSPVERQA